VDGLPEKARRALAWELLKQTRNPEYVALRYEYPIDTMREALKRIPEHEPIYNKLQRINNPAARNYCANPGRKIDAIIEDGIGEILDNAKPSREPGEDDG